MSGKDDLYPASEIARRRDEVIRRMANTPPQPRVTRPPKKQKAKAAAPARAARKRPKA
jgi:hypothetical protein